MQVLEMRLKLVVQWILEKKQAIATLVNSHLPIYRAIKQFIQTYITHMEQIVRMVQKIMKDLHITLREGNNQTLYDLFELIRQKELVGVEEWSNKLVILENKYNKQNDQSKQFPDIFKDIDTNIEYYEQLRVKLKLAITKSSQRQQNQANKHMSRNIQGARNAETDRNRNIFKTYAEYTERYPRKTDLYAGLYDKQYGENKHTKVEPLVRQNGKIKKSPRHNTSPSQLSPYKLVNPKYQLSKQELSNKEKYETKQKTTPAYSHPRQVEEQLSRNQKYNQYKKQLYAEMNKQISPLRVAPKFTAEKYLYETPLKNFNKQYSTAYTDRYDYNRSQDRNQQSEGLKYHYWSDNKKKQLVSKNNQEDYSKKPSSKKYQYLFEQDSELPIKKSPKTQIFQPRPQNYQSLGNFQPNRPPTLAKNNQDSLSEDRLGQELEIEMPAIFGSSTNNIEELLSSSLMSSKKWGKFEQHFSADSQQQIPQGSEDSLDDLTDRIRQTGKFKQIHYTDEDDQQVQQQKKHKPISKFNFDSPLTIQKQISSESKDLNMSFGRN